MLHVWRLDTAPSMSNEDFHWVLFLLFLDVIIVSQLKCQISIIIIIILEIKYTEVYKYIF